MEKKGSLNVTKDDVTVDHTNKSYQRDYGSGENSEMEILSIRGQSILIV